MYFTYVLYSKRFDKIYIGQTSNLYKRIQQHNTEMVISTKHYIPWELIYSEKCQTRSEAMKREKELKSHKGRDFIRNKLARVRQLPD
jgi:putative endonuclease